MKIQLTNALILDPASPFNGQKVNLLIEDGRIEKIGSVDFGGKRIDLEGALLSPGFVDLFAHFNDPGFEHKEDLKSGIGCALSGGYTDIFLIPNTHPPIASKGDVAYIKGRSGAVDLWPMAGVSEDLKGENLSEILDLAQSGALAFTDGTTPIWNSELLLKALQYLKKDDGLIVNRPKDKSLSRFVQMHEGVVSTGLGLVGEPALSEEISIIRDLEILKYAGGRLHFSQLSSAKSVDIIKRAKKDGLQVTCDVNIHNLVLIDAELESFDTRLKLDPPLRTERDRKTLIKGLLDGTIDAIVSGHQPQDAESKDLEFDLAETGATGLQVVYSLLNMLSDQLPMEVAVSKLTHSPRSIMKLPAVKVQEGFPAKLSWFNPDVEWTFDLKSNTSKSINSYFFGKKLKGKCMGVLNGTYLTQF